MTFMQSLSVLASLSIFACVFYFSFMSLSRRSESSFSQDTFDLNLYINLVFDFLRILGSGKSTLINFGLEHFQICGLI
jgi:hypothetical protein